MVPTMKYAPLTQLVLLFAQLAPAVTQSAETEVDRFEVQQQADRLKISYAGRNVGEYVFADPTILRPYFANMHAPGGLKVTRNHPPIENIDATDHGTMHPGIWLGFGDISGSDFWRNKGHVEHLSFIDAPAASADRITFATESRLLTPDRIELCRLVNRITIAARPAGWLIVWDATFRSDDQDFTFGDQEEMGFGARMATRLNEQHGGLIINSDGIKTAAATWGQPAAWCDYSGTDGQRLGGITLMAAPANFRGSWWHNRDYGVFVANPFGRAAMKQGERSTVTVRRGQRFRIVFGALLHDDPAYDPAAAYQDFLQVGKT